MCWTFDHRHPVLRLGGDAVTSGPVDAGSVSDGSHTFDELYKHRAHLFAALAVELGAPYSWRSDKHHDGTMYDGYFIAGIDLPAGRQISYHIKDEFRYLFFGVRSLPLAPVWDGHTPGDVLNRLAEFVR